MKFNRFPSIENAYRQKTIDAIVEFGYSEGLWFVTEKIHGANFQLSCEKEGDYVYPGSRSRWVGGREYTGKSFYGCEAVVEENTKKLLRLRDLLLADGFSLFGQLTVYGELFGGKYPHPEVLPVPNQTTVQSGIWYSPRQHFLAYDISLDGVFLPVTVANSYFREAGFMYARTLWCRTFKECMQYPNQFITTIPGLLGLPEIAENYCEGVVLRPENPRWFGSGQRVILKNKNEKWSEKPGTKGFRRPANPPNKLSDTAKEWLGVNLGMINENRLRNVLSKIGPVTNKDFGNILRDFSLDVQEASVVDYEELRNLVDQDDQKRVRKLVNTECAKMIRENFLNILDGEF